MKYCLMLALLCTTAACGETPLAPGGRSCWISDHQDANGTWVQEPIDCDKLPHKR